MPSSAHGPATCPQLRPGLAAQPDGESYVIHDPYRVAGPPVFVTRTGLEILRHFDGRNSLADLASALNPNDPPTAALIALADTLEKGRFLEGASYRAYLAQPVRPPVCVGVYPADPGPFRISVHKLFTGPGGPGLPAVAPVTNPIRGVLVPHMDFARGNVTYGYGFK